MEEEILKKLAENQLKLEQIYKSVERTRKYFLWTLIVTIVVIVVPLLGLAFAIPKFLQMMTGIYSGF